MKFDIMFGIMLTLINKKTVQASYLADKFNISTRTVYRYLSVLGTNNVPITTKPGRGGGITLLNTFSMLNYFSTQEKMTLITLTQNISDPSLRLSLQTKLLAIR